jgi:hypothetical protein
MGRRSWHRRRIVEGLAYERTCVLLKTQMRAVLVVIVNVVSKQPLQMSVIYRDHVVQKIPPTAFNPTLGDTNFAKDFRTMCAPA